jgi:hypothetical protein
MGNYDVNVAGMWAESLDSLSRSLTAFSSRLNEADRVSQYSSGLSAMDRAFSTYNRSIKDKRWAKPADTESSAKSVSGESGASAQLTLGQIDEASLTADHAALISTQRDFIRQNFRNKAAQEQLLAALEQRSVQHYDQVWELWSTETTHRLIADSDQNITYWAEKTDFTPEQRMQQVDTLLRSDVNTGLRRADDAAAYSEKMKREIESSWAVGTAVEQAKAAGWNMQAADAWIDANTPFWDGDPAKRIAAREVVAKEVNYRVKEIDRIKEEEGAKQWDAFREILAMDPTKLTRDVLAKFEVSVDRAHQADVRTYRERYDKYINIAPDQVVINTQQRNDLSMRADLARWKRGGMQGPPPFDEAKIIAMAAPPEGNVATLSMEAAKALQGDLQEAIGTTPKGTDPRAIAAAGINASLYGAIGGSSPVDPFVAVADGTIEQALAEGRISPEQHDSLLARRQQLHNDYVARGEKPADATTAFAAAITGRLYKNMADKAPQDPYVLVSDEELRLSLAAGQLSPGGYKEVLALRHSLEQEYINRGGKPLDQTKMYASGIESELYGAMEGDAKDPYLAVEEGEIEAARDSGKITPDQANGLLALRYSLHGNFLANSSFGKTTAEGQAKAFEIVYDPHKTSDTKREEIKDLVVKGGLSGSDGSIWTAKIDPYNGDADKKAIIDSIRDTYGPAMEGKNVEETRAIMREMISGVDAMEAFFQKSDKPAEWRAERDRFLEDKKAKEGKAAQESLQTIMAQTFGGPTAYAEGFASRAGASGSVFEMAAAQEALREVARLPPDLQARFEGETAPSVRQLDNDVLSKAGIVDKNWLGTRVKTAVYTASVTTGRYAGETLYALTPVKYNPDTGAIRPQAGQELYVVRYPSVDGVIRPQVFKMQTDPAKPQAGEWIQVFQW